MRAGCCIFVARNDRIWDPHYVELWESFQDLRIGLIRVEEGLFSCHRLFEGGREMVVTSHFIRKFSRLLNSPCCLRGRSGDPLDHLELGALGEKVAALFLRSEGRRVLYRNFRAPGGGEVDIVARDGEVLSFVEVKTRRRDDYGRPLDAVDQEKERLIEKGADAWLSLLGTREIPWRFDVAEVILKEGELPRVNVVRDVF